MAVTTLEKNSKTVVCILQVTVNISLDIILIPQFGLMGAVAAVLLTFILTIPIRLLVIKRLIGGLWFPIKFFFKVILCCILVTIPFSLMPDLNSTWAVFLMALIMYTTELIVLELVY